MDVQENEELSLRDAVAAAVHGDGAEDSADKTPEPDAGATDVTEEPDESTESVAKPEPRTGRDETGKFTKVPKTGPVVEVKPRLGAVTKGTPPPAAVVPTSTAKAPQSWKPGVREKFSTLPPEVQQEALRIDREAQGVMRENAQLRQQVQQGSVWSQVVSPYQAMIQSSGQKPEQLVGNLLGLAYNIYHGASGQKEQAIAYLIKSSRADINHLAAALDGQGGPQQSQQQQLSPEQIAAQVRQQVMQDIQRTNEQGRVGKAQSEIDNWSQDKEYVDDLRELMAIELEADANRKARLPDGHPAKRAMSLDEAYERAAASHPDLAPIFEQRKEAERVAKANADAQKRRAAGSSVRGSPAGGDVDNLPDAGEDIRSDIMRSVRALGRR